MLGNKKRIHRNGKHDEKFGIGWGLDEADLCLRAIRKGGRYGRQGDVEIIHEMHGTFGNNYTKYDSNARTISLTYFQKKYGGNVDETGRSIHWWPLAGIQVLLFSENKIDDLIDCVSSLNKAFEGYRWILKIIFSEYSFNWINSVKKHFRVLNYDRIYYYKWASNQISFSYINKVTEKHKNKYPAIYLIHEKYKISNQCINNMLWKIRESGDIAAIRNNDYFFSEWFNIRSIKQIYYNGQVNIRSHRCEAIFNHNFFKFH